MQKTKMTWFWRAVGTAALTFGTSTAALAQQAYAYVNFAGGTGTGAAMVAADSGGIDTGMLREPKLMLAAAPRKMEPPKIMDQPTPDRFGLQTLYSQYNEQSLSSQRNGKLLKEISAIYLRMQEKNPELIIDVLTIPARGVKGLERSKSVALRIAEGLRDNGVKNVRLDFNPDFPPTKQTRPAPKST
jgi:hypothetical protein